MYIHRVCTVQWLIGAINVSGQNIVCTFTLSPKNRVFIIIYILRHQCDFMILSLQELREP